MKSYLILDVIEKNKLILRDEKQNEFMHLL